MAASLPGCRRFDFLRSDALLSSSSSDLGVQGIEATCWTWEHRSKSVGSSGVGSSGVGGKRSKHFQPVVDGAQRVSIEPIHALLGVNF
jgi:hypothetical protein